MVWTSPRTWVAGENPTAATLNLHIRDQFKAIGDPWTTYTGGDTNITTGNGTLAKKYTQAGKRIDYSIELTFGSSTAFGGPPRFGLPAAPRIATNGAPMGTAYLFDTSAPARRQWCVAYISANTGVVPLDDSFAGIDVTAPWTWATGDQLIITGTYEAA